MGCSNARLLVQAPLAAEPGAGMTNPSSDATSPINVAADSNNITTRMHLTGVDLVVERNGSYTLLLTPKTHKQLMPYVLRKKRFRILVDKVRSNSTLPSNEPLMESNKELKFHSKKDKKSKQQMESTIESIEQAASDEYNKAKARFVGGRSIDRGNPEDDDENIQSDDEGMIEEIVTTVEEAKDLECKIKKKIETKKTTAQDPETHNKITKVVKTEVTEITRTITINDEHDLERAKRELGIDDVNRFLPTSMWIINQPRLTQLKEKRYEPTNEIVTSKDFPSDSPIKAISLPEETPLLAQATLVGRGPVIETISSPTISTAKPIEIKKKKKKSKLCSCTRPADDEQPPQQQQKQRQVSVTIPKQEKKISVVIPSAVDTQIAGQQLISPDMKQLIVDKKFLLIDYIHSKVFSSSNLFSTNEQDLKGRKISSRILDLLRYDRCSSWTQMSDQLTGEYADRLPANSVIQPMIKTYEDLFTNKQSNFLNTFSTIHHENDIQNIPENYRYITVIQTHMNERDNQSSIDVIAKHSVGNMEDTFERLENNIQQENDEQVINDDQPTKEVNMTDDVEQNEPIYNEEQLIKMLADISQHKPITLAEAIAYEYIDIEDAKLGLSNDTIQRIKNLFRPLSDETTSNLIRIKRSGEHLTDVNLAEINPFEKLNLTEPFIYQLQQTFEPTLDFNEKQFRSLTDAILNNKEQYEELQFDIARTILPMYDMKESSTNDFSQSDSGYSMTTATHESLASKIKIEFEPINRDIPILPKRDDLYDEERIDLDKASSAQLDKYELNHDLIQIIKSDFNGSDKTIGQAVLSRELRLDSTDPSDIAHLNSLGIHKEQARILTTFFFPKQTRTIAYSPEPGRFVEAQTTYNPDYPGYKTDTTIIQIQEKQLSSDHLAMQRNIHDDRASPILSKPIIEPEPIVSTPQEIVPAVVSKEKTPPPTPVQIKKRKSSGTGGLLSCFRSKKPKAGSEQHGQPTILVSQTSVPQQIIKPIEQKPMIDYAILPDGKRIYIDVFQARPGLDMSYKPHDFDNRFVIPISKPASEYERPITPELKLETVAPIQSEIVKREPQPLSVEPEIIEHKVIIHSEPRPATIAIVDVQSKPPPIVVPLTKREDITTSKSITSDLHSPAVILPEIELVKPGPLPTIPIKKGKKSVKVKTSHGGLCASCFGAKAGEKKKKDVTSESIKAPTEQKKSIAEEKKEDLPPTTIITSSTAQSSSSPSPTNDAPILPRVNIDQFKERNFQKSAENLPKPEDRLEATIERIIPTVEPHHQLSNNESLPTTATVGSLPLHSTTNNASIFSTVNIDQFKERTFQKSTEHLPKSKERTTEEPHYQLPTSAPIPPPVLLKKATIEAPAINNASASSKVNIDQFRERTFEKSVESLPRPEERVEATTEKIIPTIEPHYQSPTIESLPLLSNTNQTSASSKVNIDQFKERTFQKSTESLPRPEQRVEVTTEKIIPSIEPHYQLPTNESLPLLSATNQTSVSSKVNIDQFRERNFEKSTESLPRPEERIEAIIEKIVPTIEPHYQLPAKESLPLLSTTNNASASSKVNIDQFRERTFEKSTESLPKPEERIEVTNEKIIPPIEPHYQSPTIESLPLLSTTNDKSASSKVNIDQFRERTFGKSTESLPKSEERIEVTNEKIIPIVEPHHQSPTVESLPLLSTTNQTSTSSKVNIDQFRERTFEKSTESLPRPEERVEVTIEKIIPTIEPHYQLLTNESLPLLSTTNNASASSKVNIDQFRERTFEKCTESLPKPEERIEVTNEKIIPAIKTHYQSPTIESLPLLSNTNQTSASPKVNIDQFRERTFEKSTESLPRPEQRVEVTIEKLIPTIEPHYQLPTNQSLPLLSTTNQTSVSSKVNIDQFRERTFEKSTEKLHKSGERTIEESHYQLPTNEPIPSVLSTTATIESPPSLPTKTTERPPPIYSDTKDSSIYSRVNIDQFKERTFDKSTQSRPKPEAPHYQLQSDAPVPPSLQHATSIPERNTYDIPRSTVLQQTTQTENMTPSTADIQKSSGDFHPTTIKSSQKLSTKTKKSKQKSGLFSTFFRQSERKSKIPALDLPSIERDLSPNNQLRPAHRHDSDPLRIPNTNLPKPNLPLPTYDHPEVNMTTGQTKKSTEFSIPVVDLPPIPNLHLPENDHQPIHSNIDLMKIPTVQLPELQFQQENNKLPHIEFKRMKEDKLPESPKILTIETGLALASPVDDMLSIQIDHKNFPIETDYAVNIESIIPDNTDIVIQPEFLSTEQKYTITDTHFVQPPELTLIIDKQTSKLPDFTFQLPSPEPVLALPKNTISSPPSFNNDVPIVSSTLPTKSIKKQYIESQTGIKTKSSTLALCSCFGDKSNLPKKVSIAVPKTSLPVIDMPLPASNMTSTLKTKGPLRAPSNDLPQVNLTPTPTETVRLPSLHIQDKKRSVSNETEAIVPQQTNVQKEIRLPTPPLPIVEKIKVKSDTSPSVVPEMKTIQRSSPSFEIKAPVMKIPEIDLSGPSKSDAYISLSKQEETISIPEPIQSRSDSGLEAIVSSHIQPSSTFGDIEQHPSISSGLGSEILDSVTSKGYTLTDIRVHEPKRDTNHDFTRKITMNDETRAKLIFRQNELNKCLEHEISKSIDSFDPKKDQKSLNKILIHAIDLIKDKKVTTYPELKQKLIVEHKNDAFIVDPVVRSLYCAIEKQGLDNLDKPEFPLAIRDMVRLPAKQTYDTVTRLNKETASLSTTQMTKETSSPIPDVSSSTQVAPGIEKKSSDHATTSPITAARSCLSCGRSKSKTKLPLPPTTINIGLLDERRRLQLYTHRNELGPILRDHIQSSDPPIRQFAEHTKESEKIIRKSLTLLSQPKNHSYEQIRHDLKGEYKQTFYLIDPIIDIVRDTIDHCDITQMNDKTNLNILDSNISQTAHLYNNQTNILTFEELKSLKSNQLSWLQQYLIDNESKEKKLTRKQNKELNKILHRALNILSSDVRLTWEELTSQLQREYPKAHDLSNRSVELIKQGQKDGLFLLQQAPTQDKRRASYLITDRAKQNLKVNRPKVILSVKNLLTNRNKSLQEENHIDNYLNKTFSYLQEQKVGQFKNYNDLKVQLKSDFKNNHEKLIEQIVDVIEQAHATNQFDDIDKPEVQTLMRDRLDGKPLVIKEMYVSLPPRTGAYGTSKYSNDESAHHLSTSINGDGTLNNSTVSHRVGRGLSWREANERARILFYRGKHPAIHYDEQAAGFDVRMLLETASGGTQEIPVSDSDIHELLNSCGVQWDGVNIISLVDHSEDVVRAAEQAALKVIREKCIVGLRTPPPPTTNEDNLDESVGTSSS